MCSRGQRRPRGLHLWNLRSRIESIKVFVPPSNLFVPPSQAILAPWHRACVPPNCCLCHPLRYTQNTFLEHHVASRQQTMM